MVSRKFRELESLGSTPRSLIMNIKTTLATIFVALFLVVPAISQANPQHQINREAKVAQRGSERQQRASEPQPEHRFHSRAPVRQFPRAEQREHRDDRRSHGSRIVIVPRLSFHFPFFHRGYRVTSVYEMGRRDGFLKGCQDSRFGFCDPEFLWDDRNAQNGEYKRGFLDGYARGCTY
jgi:hypothetical protein